MCRSIWDNSKYSVFIGGKIKKNNLIVVIKGVLAVLNVDTGNQNGKLLICLTNFIHV